MNPLYGDFLEYSQKQALLGNALGVLSWDQEVNLPSKGVGIRAANLSFLSGESYERRTDPKFVDTVKRLLDAKNLTEEQQANIRETWRSLERSLKVDKEFVENFSRTASECFVAWHKAKSEKNFEIFAPVLEKMIELKKQEARLMGFEKHPYDALLEEFEPGLTVGELDVLFSDVRSQLVNFVQKISTLSRPDDSFFSGEFEESQQEDFCRLLLEKMGYDFEAGRMDRSSHPFCIGLHPTDTRITYRLKRNDISEIIWSITHEGGHALYEQGMLPENWGLPMGQAVSLSIHESQSRLWENNVSRSREYWNHFLPELRKFFPGKFDSITAHDFFRACNIVEPSFIRTNADELTYHFHIMIRFEIEKAILDGSLAVNDLPSYWNSKYKEYLGIEVPDDAQGILQDVHWSHGSFGYFPTYSLGSFYAAQFFATASKEIPQLKEKISQGELSELREWLRESVHKHGMRFKARDLCIRVTGEPLRFEHFMNYAYEKYTEIYPGLR